ncbi:hypothetical protein OG900_11390 [Streptomyces sp. NBC_00433]
MDANTVTAICATGIATASFAVTIMETRANRQHNRHSVAPILELWARRRVGGPTGILIANYGLGPAIITQSRAFLDGVDLGPWAEEALETVRRAVQERPHGMALNHRGVTIPAGNERFLLSTDAYDPRRHSDLWDLVWRRLTLKIDYESLYRTETLSVSLRTHDSPPFLPGAHQSGPDAPETHAGRA